MSKPLYSFKELLIMIEETNDPQTIRVIHSYLFIDKHKYDYSLNELKVIRRCMISKATDFLEENKK